MAAYVAQERLFKWRLFFLQIFSNQVIGTAGR